MREPDPPSLNAPDLTQACAEMSAILGLDAPVDEAVLVAAVDDTNYAHKLLVCRGDPEFMSDLLANPPAPAPRLEAPGTLALAGRAALSLAQWARTGFSTLPEEHRLRRLAACAECPHLRAPDPAKRKLYALAGAAGDAPSVCGLCGCVVAVKARRPGETCPDLGFITNGLNRWGDPPAAPA